MPVQKKSGNLLNAPYIYQSVRDFQESTTILNACTKKSGNLLNAPYIYQSVRDFQESTTILNACTKKVWKLETYWMHHISISPLEIFKSLRQF